MAPKKPTNPTSQFGAKPIQALLRENETLLPFHQRLRQLSRLQKTFVEALPTDMGKSCRIATVEESTIIVAAANGAIAAKLKQMLPRLLEKFHENKKQYQEVTGFSVIVQPDYFIEVSGPKIGPLRAPIPTEKLEELAESLEDSPLKTALNEIASKRQRALTNKQKAR